MEEGNIYKKLDELINRVDGNFNILEEQIDVDLQMRFFEESFQVKEKILDKDELEEIKTGLFSEVISDSQKKEWLVSLSVSNDVENLRLIESFVSTCEGELKSWSILALQQSRMRLSSELLDEQQVFISTGLGGKGTNLRYFLAFRNKTGAEFTSLQQKILRSEVEFTLSKSEATLEEISFHDYYVTIVSLIPLHVQIQDLFREIIDECNHMGDFLEERYIITNVKKLSIDEIDNYYRDNLKKEKDEESD